MLLYLSNVQKGGQNSVQLFVAQICETNCTLHFTHRVSSNMFDVFKLLPFCFVFFDNEYLPKLILDENGQCM